MDQDSGSEFRSRQQPDLALECYKEVLNAVDRGFFTISLRDAYRIELFGQAARILHIGNEYPVTLMSLLRLDQQQKTAFEKWLTVVQRLHRVQEWPKLTHIAPLQKFSLQLSRNDIKTFRLSYKDIRNENGLLEKILVQIDDITEEKQREEQYEAQISLREHEVRTILTVANMPHDELMLFIMDSETRISKIQQIIAEQIADLRATHESQASQSQIPREVHDRVNAIFIETILRDLHTIKGNAATYGFPGISEESHQAESYIVQMDPDQPLKQLRLLRQTMERVDSAAHEVEYIKKMMYRIFGRENSISVRIPKKRIDSIQDLCNRLKSIPVDPLFSRLINQCMTLVWRPLATLTRKYQRIVQKRAEILQKDVEFIVEGGQSLWPADLFSPIDDALSHLVANAIIHGIEDKKTRFEQNKGRGKIRFRMVRDNGMLSISISDDGCGIDTAKLVRRSVEKGVLPAQMAQVLNESQKLELIFSHGVSTIDETTSLAGRGVGMDIVREQIQALDGTISIFSEVGKGTTFSIRFPSMRLGSDPFVEPPNETETAP